MERVKKELFLTYFSIDPILDVSAGSVEIHFHLALLSEVKKKAVFCIRPVSFHDSHQHTGVFTVGAHKLVGLYRVFF